MTAASIEDALSDLRRAIRYEAIVRWGVAHGWDEGRFDWVLFLDDVTPQRVFDPDHYPEHRELIQRTVEGLLATVRPEPAAVRFQLPTTPPALMNHGGGTDLPPLHLDDQLLRQLSEDTRRTASLLTSIVPVTVLSQT